MAQRVRIKLKSFDHTLVDQSAEKIVKTVWFLRSALQKRGRGVLFNWKIVEKTCSFLRSTFQNRVRIALLI